MKEQKLPVDYQEQITTLALQTIALCLRINLNTPYCTYYEWAGHVHGISVRISPNKDKNSSDWIADTFITSLTDKADVVIAAHGLKQLQYLVQNLQCIMDGYDIIPLLPRCVSDRYSMGDLARPPLKEVTEDERT